jgi:S-DNA-T family DNA segregation ATPase FtsK/SpoIIIE
MRIGLTALTSQGPRDVVVSGDDTATAGQVAEAVRATLAPKEQLAPVLMYPGGGTALGVRPPLWVNGQQVGQDTLARQVLRDGAVITTESQIAGATSMAEPGGVAELRVIGGPGAGTVHRLGPGNTAFGSGPQCYVRLPVPGVPAQAGTVNVAWGIATPTLHPQAPGLLLDGKPVEQSMPWEFGAVLRVGTAVMQLARPEAPDAHLSPVDGGFAYHRPPRLATAVKPVKIEVPVPPPARAGRFWMLLASVGVPIIFGGVMVYVTKQWIYSMFMLMSPVMYIGQTLGNRTGKHVSYRRRQREYREKMATLPGRISAAQANDEITRRENAPDPARILLTATGPRRRLWERRADDADTLRMRIGLFDGPSLIELVPAKKDEHVELPRTPVSTNVPVSLPLPKFGVVGIAGPVDASRALARWMVAQAAVLHSPRDLSIVVLTADPAAGQHWNWVRWLPHCAPRGAQDCVALVGGDTDSAGRRIAELVAEVTARSKASQSNGTGFNTGGATQMASSDLGPKILIVLDGARQLRRIPGMPQILAAAKQTGVYSICIDESQRVLPEECDAVLSWEIPGGAAHNAEGVHHGPGGWAVASHEAAAIAKIRPFRIRVHGQGLENVPPLLADQVTAGWADRVARALAPVRDVSRDDSDSMIPASARMLDMIGIPNPSFVYIQAAWKKYGRTTKVPIGLGADGIFMLDLVTDGPHGLVAGTTGAGKSEFLQSLIAVLAVVNRPEAMNFVLIDYKGGSAFKDCARLPHTVGMVSDLDGHLTIRALASLGAELKRREEQLLAAGAKDIEDYWDTKKLQPELEPMPRLVLIIDEFAAMVAELPDFVHGLIDIARRGRSLGVHLILATQRPAGVVSADIRANTNLRIALRVTSPEESTDVIDAREAAHIAKSTPGRCYVRSGASSPVAVQSARIGGRRPGAGPVSASATITALSWTGLGRGLPAPSSAGPDEESMATDLSVLVEAIRETSGKLGVSPQRRPWLEPLPSVLTLASLPDPGPSRSDLPPIPYGLTDLPHRQAREALTLDFGTAGHTVVAGGAHSGRSTLLRTLAGSVAATVSPADVHIYGIDCGTGALLPVSDLPHCGAVVQRDQPDRIERLLSKIRGEIARRQQLLAAQGFTGLAEQRAAGTGTKLPWMLLLLDGWESYVAAFENYDYGRLIDTLLQVLREGAAVGLRAMVTTDRAALIGQPGSVFSQRLVLRMTDRSDCVLADINERDLPAHQAEGRVLFAAKPNPLEAQVALLAEEPGSLAQAAALRQIGVAAADRYGRPPHEVRPLRVDALPSRISFDDVWRLDPDFAPPSPLWAMVGAGGDELAPAGLDVHADGPGLVVAGPPRSGKSTTLLVMAHSLLRAATPIVVIAPRRSPLRTLDGTPGVLGVLGADFTIEFLRETLNPLERYVVLVDDAEMLADAPNAHILERIILTGRDADHGLILAGPTAELSRCYSGFIPTALKSRSGVLVAVETPDDGGLFGVRLPRNAGPGPTGRGLLVRPGTTEPVQLAIS